MLQTNKLVPHTNGGSRRDSSATPPFKKNWAGVNHECTTESYFDPRKRFPSIKKFSTVGVFDQNVALVPNAKTQEKKRMLSLLQSLVKTRVTQLDGEEAYLWCADPEDHASVIQSQPTGQHRPASPTTSLRIKREKKRCGLCNGATSKDDVVSCTNELVTVEKKATGPTAVFKKRLHPTYTATSLVAVSQLGHGSFGRVYLVAERADAMRVKSRRHKRNPARVVASRSSSLESSGSSSTSSDDATDEEDDASSQCGNLSPAERKAMSALKTIPLATLNSRKKVEHVRYERKVIELLRGHPNVIELRSAWRCSNALYLLTEVAWGGELFRHLQHTRRFEPRQVAFFAAEISSALTFAHSRRVVYRDLKPENVLLDDRGHVKLVDFGLSKILTSPNTAEDSTRGCRSLCGTPEYMSPETLDRREYGQAVDFWALGMLTAELLSGLPPWYTNERDELFRRIRFDPLDLTPVVNAVQRTAKKAIDKGCPLSSPAYDVAMEAADFISRLLDRTPIRRLGCSSRDGERIIDHAFIVRYGFDIDADVLAQSIPPYDPTCIKPPPHDGPLKAKDDGVDGLVASLHTHLHRAPLVSLTVDDISHDLQREKAADPVELEARSRQIRAWSYCQGGNAVATSPIRRSLPRPSTSSSEDLFTNVIHPAVPPGPPPRGPPPVQQ